jgi:hypothetical protein
MDSFEATRTANQFAREEVCLYHTRSDTDVVSDGSTFPSLIEPERNQR